jgi:hypothetical protein
MPLSYITGSTIFGVGCTRITRESALNTVKRGVSSAECGIWSAKRHRQTFKLFLASITFRWLPLAFRSSAECRIGLDRHRPVPPPKRRQESNCQRTKQIGAGLKPAMRFGTKVSFPREPWLTTDRLYRVWQGEAKKSWWQRGLAPRGVLSQR